MRQAFWHLAVAGGKPNARPIRRQKIRWALNGQLRHGSRGDFLIGKFHGNGGDWRLATGDCEEKELIPLGSNCESSNRWREDRSEDE